MLSIPNLAQRLNERFRILTGGSRDVLPRQKTLRALIDWSYDLLTPQEQLLVRAVGRLRGRFRLWMPRRVSAAVRTSMKSTCLDLLDFADR